MLRRCHFCHVKHVSDIVVQLSFNGFQHIRRYACLVYSTYLCYEDCLLVTTVFSEISSRFNWFHFKLLIKTYEIKRKFVSNTNTLQFLMLFELVVLPHKIFIPHKNDILEGFSSFYPRVAVKAPGHRMEVRIPFGA